MKSPLTSMRFLVIILLSLAASSPAWAHAFLDHADPRVGSTLPASPTAVKIWFTEELEPAFSRIQVFDSQGGEVDRKDVKVDPANPILMTVSVPKLAPGTYKVVWHAVATDTHHTQGSFTFEVKRE
jgi:methionine-rich copper-binding protein CopC